MLAHLELTAFRFVIGTDARTDALSLAVMDPQDLVAAVAEAQRNLHVAVNCVPDEVGRMLLIAEPYLSAIQQNPMGWPNSVAATAVDAILFAEEACPIPHRSIMLLRNNVQDVFVLACCREVRNVHHHRLMNDIFNKAFDRNIVEHDINLHSRLFMAIRKNFGENPDHRAARKVRPRRTRRPLYVQPAVQVQQEQMAGPPADTDAGEALYVLLKVEVDWARLCRGILLSNSVVRKLMVAIAGNAQQGVDGGVLQQASSSSSGRPAIEAMCAHCWQEPIGGRWCAHCWQEHFDRL